MARILSITVSLFLVVLAVPTAASTGGDPFVEQRRLFQQAEDALKRGHLRTYRRLLSELGGYPLKPYLEYERLRRWMRRVSDTEIQRFLARHEDLPIADRLRSRWLKRLARQKRWEKFLAEYRPVGGTSLKCLKGRALFAVGREEEAMALARELWLVGRSQPRACDPLFARWTAEDGRTAELTWQRIRLAMNNGRTSLARYLARALPEADQAWVQRWIRMRRAPAEALHHKEYQRDTALAREIVRYGVRRLARRDPQAAYDFWQTVRERHLHRDGVEAVNEVDRYIALRAAYRGLPQALPWLEAVMRPDKKVREWRIRTALRQGQWGAALTWIDALPAEEQRQSRWRYWRARIMARGGEERLPTLELAARRQFADLARERDFYGFLAADRLGHDYSVHSEPLNFSEKELRAFARRPALVRARELFRLGRLADARREWNRAIRGLDERGLRLAAVLASRWGWHDRAILTVARSAHFDDLDLRFPLVYRRQVLAEARKFRIDPAWVYGVIRQESLYMVDARSSAGALGLMQVMPNTGRLTARLLNTRLRSTRELLEADKNIRIGAAYLRRMHDTFGNPVVATAAYNAGPQRVRQWLPEQPLEADLWVETVPFSETRQYVQRVMAYTVIFDHRLDGRFERLSRRMPKVVQRPGEAG